MNFAEGIKRVYVTLACLVLVISAIALVDDRPREDRYDRTTADLLKNDIAEAVGKTRYGVDWGDTSNIEFIQQTCSHPSTQYSAKRKDICDRRKFGKTELPKELVYHAAYSVGILILVALGASLLWMLLAWIARGFMTKQE